MQKTVCGRESAGGADESTIPAVQIDPAEFDGFKPATGSAFGGGTDGGAGNCGGENQIPQRRLEEHRRGQQREHRQWEESGQESPPNSAG